MLITAFIENRLGQFRQNSAYIGNLYIVDILIKLKKIISINGLYRNFYAMLKLNTELSNTICLQTGHAILKISINRLLSKIRKIFSLPI